MLVGPNERADGILFLIELLLLSAGQETAVGLHVAAFLPLDGAVIAHQLFGLSRSQLAAAQPLIDAGSLVGQPVVDFGTARMVFIELALLRRRGLLLRRGGMFVVADQLGRWRSLPD